MDKSKVGKNIKEARKASKLTQQQLADKIHRTESSIRKYEKGIVLIPNDIIEEIARALEVSPLDLLGVDEWEEEFNANGSLSKEVKIIEQIQEQYGKKAVELLQSFIELNESGKIKALESVFDLTEIKKYTEK